MWNNKNPKKRIFSRNSINFTVSIPSKKVIEEEPKTVEFHSNLFYSKPKPKFENNTYDVTISYLNIQRKVKCIINIVSNSNNTLEIKVNEPYYRCEIKLKELVNDYIQELEDLEYNKKLRIKRVENLLKRTNQQTQKV